MHLIDGKPVYAATDLVGYLACEHRLALERAAMHGLVARPVRNDPSIELVAKRGLEHEQRYLADLRARGLRVVEIEKDGSMVAPGESPGAPAAQVTWDPGADLRAAQAATIEAMAGGADVVYQATFFDGTWRGHADFLLKVDHGPDEPDSAFGPWHYEVADTKLARHVKASAILQVCSYVEQLTAIQGVQPARLHIVLGGSARPTDERRVDDFMAYYRRVKAEFEAAVRMDDPSAVPVFPPVGTYPEPVEHCDVCRWAPDCRARRRGDDDLSLVANAARKHRTALKAHGVATRRGLAAHDPHRPVEGVGAAALERVHRQALIQVESQDAGRVLHELLPLETGEDGQPVPGRGLLGLPAPSEGDLFLDLEGDPFALDDGVDYLFGILEPALAEDDPRWTGTGADGPVPKFHAIWSLDDGHVTWAAEKAAFERTVDLIMDRWERDPGMHVYHYAPYEHTALGRLAQRHGTRELEVDRLLRAEVLVDLFRVVRQGLRAGVESYSIKKIEPLYSLVREQNLKDAGSSIVAFETWLEMGEDVPVADADKVLDGIAAYNRDDVVSNWRLRAWLEERRAELEAREGRSFPRPAPQDGAASATLSAREQELAEVAELLTAGVAADPAERALDPEQDGRWLLAQLLGWHRREAKSAWWRYYDLAKHSPEELIEEREPIGGLEPVGDPYPDKRSMVWTFTFPPQEHKLSRGADVHDPLTRKSAGELVAIDEATCTLQLKRGPSFDGEPLPRALIPKEVVESPEQQESLLRTGRWVAAHGLVRPAGVEAGGPDLAAARALLLRTAPGDGVAPLVADGETTLQAAIRLGLDLDGRVLPIQGPPGSGKTYTGGHMIVALVEAGKRVGVVANSHKVIGNLLKAVDDAADEVAKDGGRPRPVVRIGQKPGQSGKPTYGRALTLGSNAAVADGLRDRTLDVVGATAWAWSRAEMANPTPIVDVLFVDEAGQFSLANVLACAPAARGIVLLGDPQQLDQPLQGSHPPGAERSALGHILGERATIEPQEGLFLARTWRLHPAICGFTSEAFYERRLLPQDGTERQLVDAPGTLGGTGMRFVPVAHEGNATDSAEEAAAVVELACELLAAKPEWHTMKGTTEPVTLDDIVIVAPYNAHVGEIERAFAQAGMGTAFVGTVDKFQGQERPISIYAMGTSAPEDAPRGMEFLYSLNRLNVATSRARCVTVIVCSPSLLRVACHTPRQMQLANGLCLAVEAAERQAAGRPAMRPAEGISSGA